MQMSMSCGGDFTTKASVVDQISKRQDVCQVSSKNPTTPLAFISYFRKLLLDNVFIAVLFNYYNKIASKDEGRKPSREQYIAESEFALLGILSKQCLIIYISILDSSEQHGWKQK